MASLDSLPPDQRAVLQLVLQRGRSYDEIAQMLAIDRAAVRERALNAFDALGPGTRVPPERRALITDYLLGQLPTAVADDTREHLAQSAPERAWARVVASELGPLTSGPLPEIPVEAPAAEAARPSEPEPEELYEPPAAPAQYGGPVAAGEPEAPAEPAQPAAQQPPREPRRAERQPAPAPRRAQPEAPGARPSSRRGGAILLIGGGVLIAAVIIAIVLISSGGGSSSKTSTSSTPTSTAASTTSTGTTSTASAHPVAQVNLTSPTGNKKTLGIAEVLQQGSALALVIAAQGLPPNGAHDAYAVWLYNSASDAKLLGFVNPGVKANGVLRAETPLPANASHFKQLLVTFETQAKPHGPGKIVLQGALNIA